MNLVYFYTNYILESMNEGTQVDAIYTDFCMAFDKIDHVILFRKLSAAGLMMIYFDGSVDVLARSQAVVLGRHLSYLE